MPQNFQTQQPVHGWFIPAQPAAPAKKKMPLLLRLVLGAAVGLAIVLGSHTNEDGPSTTPPQTPAATTPPTTASTGTP
ncbi:hypothetical protein GCM10018785_27090 [Streptomyces longispororuber]|uniref:Uncharacterized protein n=1 Tax=Streptomyces longispororuber TaxID=68230 RepID=A0A918ZKK1_9ACTN|nr:hypothetical protein [Streptomyces longispororuber]GHE56374.1 hypothetical protein GCM10018785_27090 [Streptomyces longispororuber]